MNYLPFLIFLMSCSPIMMKTSEDIIQGEISVVEQAVKDISGVQPQSRPIVVPIKKF